MEIHEKREFIGMLTEVLAAYGKGLPEGALLKAWWDNLAPFPLRAVALAFAEYRAQQGEYAPVPAGIAKRCQTMDGRPTADEAWAVALTGRDEADTVVWTAETAEAFGLCASVLNLGDEVGARRAFIDAYNRLVGAARLAGKPAQWQVSLGWDMAKRIEPIRKATAAGLLSAPAVAGLLPPPAPEDGFDEAPRGLKVLKEEVAKLQAGWADRLARRSQELAAEREAERQKKAEIAEQVTEYLQQVAQK